MTDDAKESFLEFLRADGKTLEALTASDGIDAILRFYEQVRFPKSDLEADGDTLLYQYGIYDWQMGDGEWFELNVTRQLTLPCEAEDSEEEGDDEFDQDSIFQLSLTFLFSPTEELRSLEGNKWCSLPEEVVEFRDFIYESAAFQSVANTKHHSVELNFEEQ